MLILNFSHPLTEDQRAQIEALTDEKIAEVRRVPSQMDSAAPFIPQIRQLVDSLKLSPDEWQTVSILVVPPALNFSAAMLLAHLHGRMGYFPPIVRIRPIPESLPPRYEVAEIINLQAEREAARKTREA